jgi:hypothetical protein
MLRGISPAKWNLRRYRSIFAIKASSFVSGRRLGLYFAIALAALTGNTNGVSAKEKHKVLIGRPIITCILMAPRRTTPGHMIHFTLNIVGMISRG